MPADKCGFALCEYLRHNLNLPAKIAVHFKPGKEMRGRVNEARDKCGIME
jgi:hypothetical protein